MLRRTFLHIPGIGAATERRLWTAGVRDWDSARGDLSAGLSPRLGRRLADFIPRSVAALEAGDAAFFRRLSQAGHAWRAYSEFAHRAVFLDIETNGATPAEDGITLVGLFDGREYEAFLAEENLSRLPERMAEFSMVVTFNGARFDLPVLARAFRRLRLPPLHLDLCLAGRHAGWRGGLKGIERQLGIQRAREIDGLDGFDAVRLWREFQRGSQLGRQRLIEYNRADVVNLLPLTEHLVARLAASLD